MKQFSIKKLPYDITATAGLALVGKYTSFMYIPQRMNKAFPGGSGGISNSDIITAYLVLLTLGKNDFEAIESHRNDNFFLGALGLNKVPSCSTLRQRMDANAANWFELTDQLNMALLGANYGGQPVDFGALPCDYMPMDWDTFVMNNEGTKKESVSRTYQGVDGYTPSVAYLGQPTLRVSLLLLSQPLVLFTQCLLPLSKLLKCLFRVTGQIVRVVRLAQGFSYRNDINLDRTYSILQKCNLHRLALINQKQGCFLAETPRTQIPQGLEASTGQFYCVTSERIVNRSIHFLSLANVNYNGPN